LTYDDGPSAKFTPGALANLASLKKKATFFWLAQNVKQYPDIVKKAIEAGMPVENHSYTHANLPKLGPQGLDKEIVQSTAAEAQIYGQKPKFFRCPYGAGVSVSRIRQKIAEQGMIHVFWNVDSLDWQDKNPDSILARVKKQMNAQKHGVVLFHDIHPQSIQASKMVLEWTDTMKGGSNEVRWVTLPEIVAELNGEKSK
jgi:peptidoglycan/xylan/chitin deacetylase (PgdA/CDA1 family)